MRRLRVNLVTAGRLPLDPRQAHHARDVLRLKTGQRVEVFDHEGSAADGTIEIGSADQVYVIVHGDIRDAVAGFRWTVASALPKGARADWMVEKLSELGAHAFVPLITSRSVVAPEGKSKLGRWARLAEESARQSRRIGVMTIEPPIHLPCLLEHLTSPAWFLSAGSGAAPIVDAIARLGDADELTLLIGPEGGWSPDEIAALGSAGLTAVSLGATILRVETAAVAAGAILAAIVAPAHAATRNRT